eukprot:GHVU01045503.1.p1 GENE.GHVU01045503.1~~GHVU01045503.1.p1  ORF type:complete len:612 (-),score=29.88 GHVU01045503.1:832-2667(-)
MIFCTQFLEDFVVWQQDSCLHRPYLLARYDVTSLSNNPLLWVNILEETRELPSISGHTYREVELVDQQVVLSDLYYSAKHWLTGRQQHSFDKFITLDSNWFKCCNHFRKHVDRKLPLQQGFIGGVLPAPLIGSDALCPLPQQLVKCIDAQERRNVQTLALKCTAENLTDSFGQIRTGDRDSPNTLSVWVNKSASTEDQFRRLAIREALHPLSPGRYDPPCFFVRGNLPCRLCSGFVQVSLGDFALFPSGFRVYHDPRQLWRDSDAGSSSSDSDNYGDDPEERANESTGESGERDGDSDTPIASLAHAASIVEIKKDIDDGFTSDSDLDLDEELEPADHYEVVGATLIPCDPPTTKVLPTIEDIDDGFTSNSDFDLDEELGPADNYEVVGATLIPCTAELTPSNSLCLSEAPRSTIYERTYPPSTKPLIFLPWNSTIALNHDSQTATVRRSEQLARGRLEQRFSELVTEIGRLTPDSQRKLFEESKIRRNDTICCHCLNCVNESENYLTRAPSRNNDCLCRALTVTHSVNNRNDRNICYVCGGNPRREGTNTIHPDFSETLPVAQREREAHWISNNPRTYSNAIDESDEWESEGDSSTECSTAYEEAEHWWN